jgi:hypothetical protein
MNDFLDRCCTIMQAVRLSYFISLRHPTPPLFESKYHEGVQCEIWYFFTVSDSGFCPPTPIGSARNYGKQNGCRMTCGFFSAQKWAKVEIYRPVQLSGLLTQHKVSHAQHSTDVRQDISWEFRMFSKQFSTWMLSPDPIPSLSDSGIHDHAHGHALPWYMHTYIHYSIVM